MSRLGAWARVALIDLRGDVRRFTILLACLALGVGTIAAVASVGAALQAAINRDAGIVLGGDMEIRSFGTDATAAEQADFAALGNVARVVELNARGSVGDKSSFLNLRAVTSNYPPVGSVALQGEAKDAGVTDRLAARNGVYGAIVDPQVLERLGIKIGDKLHIGSAEFEARAALEALPDQATQGFQLGLPVLISVDALSGAGLDQAGALTRYRYKIALADKDFDTAKASLTRKYPNATWEIRSPKDATANLARFFDLFSRFLVLVGLSSLLVGGVGVSNAVSAYINERQSSIATLRSLGATSSRVMVHFLIQIMLLSLVGIAIGLALGAASTLVALPVLSGMLALDLPPGLDLSSLVMAAGFGVLIAFVFAFIPLRRAQKLQPASLFRAAGGNVHSGLGWRDIVHPRTLLPLAIGLAGIGGLAVLTTGEPFLVLWYAIGALTAFGLLRLAGWLLQFALRLVPPLPNATFRQALKAIHRPGSPAPVVILSLGLGLALLLMITLLDASLRSQIDGAVADKAPSFVLIDIRKDQLPALEKFAANEPQITDFQATAMLRGTIESIGDKKVSELGPMPDDIADMFRGDTPVSWAREMPEGSRLVEGKWWAPDYSGPPLVSLSTELQGPLGLKIGDPMEISVLGRPIAVTIANFRDIDWRDGGLNFRLLFSPGLIESAPQTFMGGLKVADGADAVIEHKLVNQFPALTFLPVGDALERISAILASLGNAVALVGSLAIISGGFVLAGALAVGRKQREADAMIMKVLGATRQDVITAFVVEYGLLGALSAILAAGLGIAGAWGILTYVLEIPFTFEPGIVATVTLGAMALTIVTGIMTTWSAMSIRPAHQLRSA
jgi:putative ABC transport system permease protein